jgi:hypothetical protein
MVAGFKSEPWPASNRYPRPACVGIRTSKKERYAMSEKKVVPFPQNAVIEDVDLRIPRCIDRAALSKTHCWRLDRSRRRAFGHGADRRRQELDLLRARPQGVSRRQKRS